MLLFFVVSLFGLTQCRYYDEDAWEIASKYLLEGMVKEQDPCDNFYNYACGKWEKLYGKDSESEMSRSTDILIDLVKKSILGIDPNELNMPKFKKSLVTFYRQCIKENSSVSDMLYQLFTGIGKQIGFPPILGTNKKEVEKLLKRNIWNLLGQVQQELDVGVFFEVDVTPIEDKCGNNEMVLTLKPVQNKVEEIETKTISMFAKSFAKKKKIKINETEIHSKIRGMQKLAASLLAYRNATGTDENEDEDEGEQDNKKKNDTVTTEEWKKMTGFSITYSQLKKTFPRIDWEEYFKGLLTNDQLATLQTKNIKIHFPNKSYFDKLHKVIEGQTSETVLNYVYWVAMTRQYYSKEMDVEKAEKLVNKEDLCFQTTLDTFTPAATRAMFDFNKWNVTEWRISIELVKESVFGAFRFLVQSAEWLNKEEKLAMIEKSNDVTFYSGIPSWLNNDTVLNYKTFDFDPEFTLPENILHMRKKSFQQSMDRIFKDNLIPDDENLKLEYNAEYDDEHNSIELFLGAVIPPLYHIAYPESFKYGMLGQTIGHELFHAFNDEDTDPKSSLKRTCSKDNLRGIKDCLIQQYSSFCFDKENACIRGKNTLHENMADIDGLKVAYMAYKFLTQTGGGEPRLPKFVQLNDDQIFFLAYARGACGKDVDLVEVHPPSNSRVEIPIRNFQEAAVKFGCAMGKPLAIVDRCDIYGNYRPMNPCAKPDVVISDITESTDNPPE